MARRPASLLRLPDELLLKITHYLASGRHDKNLDLVNLAMVCQRFTPIAREVLLTRPVFCLFNVVGIVRAYLNNPGLANKVYSIEITTASRDFQKRQTIEDLYKTSRTRRAEECALPTTPQVDLSSLKLEQLFWLKCVGIIRKSETLTYEDHEKWVEHLTCPNSYMCAWLALLLMLAPNVQELLLGQNYLPYLSGIFSIFGRSRNPSFGREFPQYCFEAARRLQTQLQVMELPAFWYADFPGESPCLYAPIPMLSHFSHLKTLTVPFRVLVPIGSQDRQLDDNGKIPPHILPSSIEVLRIVDIDNTEIEDQLSTFIDVAETVFTNLRRVELYHQWAPDKLEGINGMASTRRLSIAHITLQQILASNPAMRQAINHSDIHQWFETTIDRVNLHAQEYQSALETIAANALSLGIEMYIWFPTYKLQAIDANGHPWEYTSEELRKLEYDVAVEKEKYLMSKRLEQYRRQKEKEESGEETLEEKFDRVFSEVRYSNRRVGAIGVAGEVMPGSFDVSEYPDET